MGIVAVQRYNWRCHVLEDSEECIAGWDPTCVQFNASRRACLCKGASNVFETKMVQIERGGFSWYELRPGQATYTHTHTCSDAFQGSMMRAAWPFMPLLTVCRFLCLVMRPMKRISSVRLYICHVFLSRRFPSKLPTKQKIAEC